jgi:hypothetical protein
MHPPVLAQVLADAVLPPHSLQLLRCSPCSQMLLPPQSFALAALPPVLALLVTVSTVRAGPTARRALIAPFCPFRRPFPRPLHPSCPFPSLHPSSLSPGCRVAGCCRVGLLGCRVCAGFVPRLCRVPGAGLLPGCYRDAAGCCRVLPGATGLPSCRAAGLPGCRVPGSSWQAPAGAVFRVLGG